MADYLCVLFGDYTHDLGNDHNYPNLLLGVKVGSGGYYDHLHGLRRGIKNWDGCGLLTSANVHDAYNELREQVDKVESEYRNSAKMLEHIKQNLTLSDLNQDGAWETLTELEGEVSDLYNEYLHGIKLLGQLDVIVDLVDSKFPITVCIG